MALEAIVDTLDDLDASLHEHYKKDEKSGKFVLDMTNADQHPRVRLLKDEAAQHRIKARDAENQLKPFKELGDITKVREQLDRIPELEQLAEGKVDDKKIDGLVETRLRTKLAPVERERDQWKTKATELEGTVQGFTAKERQRTIHDAMRGAIKKSKGFEAHAEEDALLYADRVFEVDEAGNVVTKDGVGVTPGITPADWLSEMQPKRPHWWGPSGGLGAPGNRGTINSGNNPWSAENWNLSEQGKILRENRQRAEQLATLAGTKVGGGKPPAKSK